jgi:hypothetical protein
MGRRGLMKVMCVLAAVAGLVAVSVPGSASASVRARAAARAASSVVVKASISNPGNPRLARLTITRNGQSFYSAPIRSRLCVPSCMLTNVTPGKLPLREVDLESTPEPDVVLGLFTGGANCCFVDQVFSYRAGTQTYAEYQHNFLNAGAVIKRIDGHYRFLSANSQVANDSFTDFADSGSPIQIWRFTGLAFVDVTRQYPSLIKTDAAHWLHAFNTHSSNGVGFIAAWAADEDLLGKSGLVSSTLASDARAGRLRSTLGLPHNSETAFVADLQKLLRKLGYTH